MNTSSGVTLLSDSWCKHLLRIEVKITDRKKLLDLGIHTLGDLFHPRAYWSLFTFLNEQFANVVIVDSLGLNRAILEEKGGLAEKLNPNYWNVLKNSVSYKVYQRHIKEFKELGSLAGLFRTKEFIQLMMGDKFQDLMECGCVEGELIAA